MNTYTVGTTITQQVTTTVARHADVLVCGGGTAGCVAALAAARNGADVVLLERGHCLGGMMTQGNAGLTKYIVHGKDAEEQARIVRQLREDPSAVQLVGGIPLEITHRLLRAGAAVGTQGTGASYVFTDSQEFKILLYEMMQEAGVQIVLHAAVCDVLRDGVTIQGVITQTKAGRLAFLGEYVIDATGDGDVAALSGVPFVVGVGPEDAVFKQELASLGQMQAVGSMFRIGGVDFDRYVAHLRAHPQEYSVQRFGLMTYEEMLAAHEQGEMVIFLGTTPSGRKFQVYNYPRPGVIVGCISVPGNRNGLDLTDLSQAEYDVMVAARQLVSEIRGAVPGFEEAFVLDVPTAGVRETRHIKGEYALDIADILSIREFDDSIGKGCHPVDIAPEPREVKEADPRDAWHFNIPYRVLVAAGRANLLLAGRCASATREAAGCLRPTVPCMVMGQAAGTAAAMLRGSGQAARDADADRLRQMLGEQGVVL
jgi:hypothetical protein